MPPLSRLLHLVAEPEPERQGGDARQCCRDDHAQRDEIDRTSKQEKTAR